jgi:hypothetical protein
MSSQMPTDQQLSRILRAYVPDRAAPDLDGRIMATVTATPQRRRMPVVVASLLAGEPSSRRTAMLLVAALLLLATRWRRLPS